MVICLERGAELHTAQLMPLSLTVSCFSKIQICFTFLVPAHPDSPRQRAAKRVCVCVTNKQDCVPSAVNVTLPAFAAEIVPWRHCCWPPAPATLMPTRRSAANPPQAAVDRRDRRTDAGTFHTPCCAYYAGVQAVLMNACKHINFHTIASSLTRA